MPSSRAPSASGRRVELLPREHVERGLPAAREARRAARTLNLSRARPLAAALAQDGVHARAAAIARTAEPARAARRTVAQGSRARAALRAAPRRRPGRAVGRARGTRPSSCAHPRACGRATVSSIRAASVACVVVRCRRSRALPTLGAAPRRPARFPARGCAYTDGMTGATRAAPRADAAELVAPAGAVDGRHGRGELVGADARRRGRAESGGERLVREGRCATRKAPMSARPPSSRARARARRGAREEVGGAHGRRASALASLRGLTPRRAGDARARRRWRRRASCCTLRTHRPSAPRLCALEQPVVRLERARA